jgi:hypothetical protein
MNRVASNRTFAFAVYGFVLQTVTACAPSSPPRPALVSPETLPATKPAEASGPGGEVFRDGGSPKSIVFVCDGSGSMINKYTMLKLHLEAAIHQLKPIQMFDIVFFQDGKASVFSRYKLGKDSMVMATEDHKRAGLAFLADVTMT